MTPKKTLNEQLLDEGPRDAPEPETAEQRSGRRRAGAAAGGLAAGGAALAKAGVLGKVFFGLFAWHALVGLWGAGGWIAAGVTAALSAAGIVYLVQRER